MIRTALLLAVAATVATPALAEQRRFALTGFDRIAVAGSDNVTVKQGGFAVAADGAASDLDKLDIKVEGGVLKIGRKRGQWGWGGKDVQVSVTLPALHGLVIAGSADVIADRGGGDQFGLKISGSGNARIANLDTKTADIAISGSGDVVAAGRCGALNLRVAGSGNADASALRCTNAAISVAGSGDVSAHVSGQATVNVAGSGDVTVTGGGRCSKKVAGSGAVRCS
ncbi:head GIN domain-containing protein [Sandarakinorhabdus sp.]|uniref:head GIN domain-containing protein n=1 Tax=Sandarakinorhabdus sp. TaxID=1916663 RepID=UPI003341EA3A